MSDESSLSSGVVRGPDGTQAAVDNDGLSVQSRPIETILEELLLTSKQTRTLLLLLVNQHTTVSLDDLDDP